MSTKRLLVVFLLLAASIVSLSAQATLLNNPGFEAATGGGQTSNSSWVLSVNLPDWVNSSAQFQDAPWASYLSGNAVLINMHGWPFMRIGKTNFD